MTKIERLIAASVLTLLYGLTVYAYEPETHSALSERAVIVSNLNRFLQTELGFLEGVEHRLTGLRIIDEIVVGSRREDDTPRFFHHFHNPLRTWDESGLRIGFQIGKASVLWGQRPDLQPASDAKRFTWQDARVRYFRGLTAQNPTVRDENLALAFRTLGHVIHLVQDAAQPAHTRNDAHLFIKPLESFVEDIRINNLDLFNQLTSGAISFNPSILRRPQNPLAPIPIARIIDTTDPEQVAAIPSAGIHQGIAEYSNANFLTFDTMFADPSGLQAFTFPRIESLGTPFDGNEPGTGKPRTYWPKVADGERVEHFVAEGTLFETLLSLQRGHLGYILDRQVLQDYAEKLLPRAIGYSAGLLDYFFRGRIDIALSENPSEDPPDQPETDITTLHVDVAHSTPFEETQTGEIVAVVSSDNEPVAVSRALTATLTRFPQGLVFDFRDNPIPSDTPDLVLTVVYKGPLGLEQDAVIAKAIEINRTTVIGTLEDILAPGTPIEGATIALPGLFDVAGHPAEAVSDANGFFEILHVVVRPGQKISATITVSAAGPPPGEGPPPEEGPPNPFPIPGDEGLVCPTFCGVCPPPRPAPEVSPPCVPLFDPAVCPSGSVAAGICQNYLATCQDAFAACTGSDFFEDCVEENAARFCLNPQVVPGFTITAGPITAIAGGVSDFGIIFVGEYLYTTAEGLVVDAFGTPVQTAFVEVVHTGQTAFTDGFGRFSIADVLIIGGGVGVAVQRSELMGIGHASAVVDGTTDLGTIVLFNADAVTNVFEITVRNALGDPMQGIEVQWHVTEVLGEPIDALLLPSFFVKSGKGFTEEQGIARFEGAGNGFAGPGTTALRLKVQGLGLSSVEGVVFGVGVEEDLAVPNASFSALRHEVTAHADLEVTPFFTTLPFSGVEPQTFPPSGGTVPFDVLSCNQRVICTLQSLLDNARTECFAQDPTGQSGPACDLLQETQEQCAQPTFQVVGLDWFSPVASWHVGTNGILEIDPRAHKYPFPFDVPFLTDCTPRYGPTVTRELPYTVRGIPELHGPGVAIQGVLEIVLTYGPNIHFP